MLEEKVKREGPQRPTLYQRLVNHLTSFSQSDTLSLQQINSRKSPELPSIAVSIFSYSNNKIEDAIQEDEAESQKTNQFEGRVSVGASIRDGLDSNNVSFRSNQHFSGSGSRLDSSNHVLSPGGLAGINLSLNYVDEVSPYTLGIDKDKL